MNPLRRAREITTLLCGLSFLSLLLLFAEASWASTGNAAFLSGTYTITPNSTGSSALANVTGITNTTPATTTGSLGFELWYSSSPYSGGPISGYKVAASYLPIGNCTSSQLAPNTSCTGISIQEALTPPPAGTYYPVLLLVEFANTCTTNNGFCIDDFQDLTNINTGGPTVTVGAGAGGGSGGGNTGSNGPAQIQGSVQVSGLDWSKRTVSIAVANVTNTSTTNTTGSLAIQLWFSTSPFNGSSLQNGYKVASFPLPASCTASNAQLGPGASCTAITSGTIPVTVPPAGTYYATVMLEEFSSTCATNSGYCVDNGVPLTDQITVPTGTTAPGGGNARLTTPISVNAIDWSSNTLTISVAGITNISSNSTSGSLAVQLWLLPTPYTGGAISGGYKVASFPLPAGCTTGNAQLGPGATCMSVTSGTLSASRPPDGMYYAAVVLDEYTSTCQTNDGYCIDDGVGLTDQIKVTTPVTAVIPTPTGSTGDSGGGGGSLDLLTLVVCLSAGFLGRASKRCKKV